MHALIRCVAFAVIVLLAVSSTTADHSTNVKRNALARLGGTRRMTNAERLARGLTPNRPNLRRSPTQQRRGMSATITTTSSSTTTSGPTTTSSPSLSSPPPPPPCTPGVIKASNTLGLNGYLNNGVLPDDSRQPGLVVVTDVSKAGTFCLDSGSPDGPLNFEATNYDPKWPAGLSLAVMVPPNLPPQFGDGSPTPGYLQLGDTTQPFDRPQNQTFVSLGLESVESAIWYLDSSTNIITAQWVDPNDDIVPVNLIWTIDFIAVFGPFLLPSPGQVLTLHWSPTDA